VTTTAELFAQHLDLRRLGARRRGVVQCVFHSDRTPSLSIDLDKGVFHCFGCGAQGGVTRFAELVGEAPPRPARFVYLGALHEARRDALAAERRAAERRTQYRPLMEASDEYRITMREVMVARAVASAAGPDAPRVWELLTLAAIIETRAHADLAEAAA
jgi:CHC2 zinc finger